MKDFVVDEDVDLKAREAGVACEEEEQEEDTCGECKGKSETLAFGEVDGNL